jgi:hypothetical protein
MASRGRTSRIGSLALCALMGGCEPVFTCTFPDFYFGDDAGPYAGLLCGDDPLPSEPPCVAASTAPCVCRDGRARTMTCGRYGVFGPCACGSLDGGAPGASLRSVAPPDPRTYDFVIHRFILDAAAEAPSNRGFYGFNLDGRFSPSATSAQAADDCFHGDYFSTVDPDQNRGSCAGGSGCQGGVDNQYPNVAQTFQLFQSQLGVQSCLSRRSSEGRGLILIRVADVDGPLGPALDDPEVTVSLYPGALPLFAECAAITRSGQPYAVDDLHLTIPGDPGSARLRFGGSIVRGRLRVTAPATSALPFALGFGGTSQLRAFQLRVSLTETDGTRGNLGGHVDQTELLETFVSLPRLGALRDAVGPLIQGFVDLATPNADGARSCESPQGGIGIGVGFEAVRARITATTSGPVDGMCGSDAVTSSP